MTEILPFAGTIALASDHAGHGLKEHLKEHLQACAMDVLDLATQGTQGQGTQSMDYPDYGYALAKAITDGQAVGGVLVCGSGIGISIAANRHAAVRAALVMNEEMATISRRHNNANVICFGERLIASDVAVRCLNVFLATAFEGGRHERRVHKLSQPI